MLLVSVSVFAKTVPANVPVVVPVAIENTVASASFLITTSLVEPCPVKISPSPAIYPMAALSPAEVSAVASTVVPVNTPEKVPATPATVPVEVIAPEPIVPKPETLPDVSNV